MGVMTSLQQLIQKFVTICLSSFAATSLQKSVLQIREFYFESSDVLGGTQRPLESAVVGEVSFCICLHSLRFDQFVLNSLRLARLPSEVTLGWGKLFCKISWLVFLVMAAFSGKLAENSLFLA